LCFSQRNEHLTAVHKFKVAQGLWQIKLSGYPRLNDAHSPLGSFPRVDIFLHSNFLDGAQQQLPTPGCSTMELVAAAVGIADITTRASSKCWKLCDLWRDAPRDIFQLRDDLDRSARFFLSLHEGLERRSSGHNDVDRAAADGEIAALLGDGCDAVEGLQDIMDELISPEAVNSPGEQLEIPKRRKFLWLRRFREVKKLKTLLNHVTTQIGFQLAYLNL